MPLFLNKSFSRTTGAPSHTKATEPPTGESNTEMLEAIQDSAHAPLMSDEHSNAVVRDWLKTTQHSTGQPSTGASPTTFQRSGSMGEGRQWSSSTTADLTHHAVQQQLGLSQQTTTDTGTGQLGLQSGARVQGILSDQPVSISGNAQASGNMTHTQGGNTFTLGGQASAQGGMAAPLTAQASASIGGSREDAQGATWNTRLNGAMSSNGSPSLAASVERSRGQQTERLSADRSGLHGAWSQQGAGRTTVQADLGRHGAAVRATQSRSAHSGLALGEQHRASWDLLRAAGSAGLTAAPGQVGLNGSATLDLVDVRAQADLMDTRTQVLNEEVGASARLSGQAGITARAGAQLQAGNGIKAAAEAFTGAKAGASLEGSIDWHRRDDYSDVLRDHFDNFPGTWDDRIVEKIPEAWLQKGGQLLFGTGTARLATLAGEVDARVGAGAQAGIEANIQDDGLIEMGAHMGGAAGVGAGARVRGGLNPSALSRLGMLKGMESVNAGYTQAEDLAQTIRERAANDAAIVGEGLETQAQKGGALGKAAQMLIDIDNAVRGKNKDGKKE